MKNLIMNTATLRRGLCLALMLCTALTSPALSQNSKSWTTVGSAGTVNDEDYDRIELTGQYAMLAVNAAAASPAVIRYNVVAVDGLWPVPPAGDLTLMRVRFRDSGDDARVIVRLRRYSTTGFTATLLELDSNDFPPSGNYQTQFVADECNAPTIFNFGSYSYFIEVEMTGTASAPRLGMIQISKGGGCGVG